MVKIGIDPCSTKNCGYAIKNGNKIIKYGLYNLSQIVIDSVYQETESLLLLYKPDIVLIEDSIGFGHAPTRKRITENTAAVKLACIHCGTKYKEINTNSAYKKVIGTRKKGDNKKRNTIKYVKNTYNIDVEEHIADAILMIDGENNG